MREAAPGGISPSLLCLSPRSTSPNTMQCSTDSYLQKHQQGCVKQHSPHCSLSSSFSYKKKILCQIRQCETQQLLIHTYTKPHFFTENYPAPSFSALSSYPSSCLHPAPRDNSLPFGRAGRQWRGQLWICSACYLMSVGMSLRACLLVPTSQASIHVESEQSIKQLADSSARVFFLLLSSLSSSLSLSLSAYFSPSFFLHLYSMCPRLFLITNKPRSTLPVRLSLLPPHQTS